MDDLLTFLQIIAGFSGPIIVAWFTAKMNKTAKENARIKELEEEKRENERLALKARMDKFSDDLTALSRQVSELSEAVDGLTRVDEKFGEKVDAIARQQKMIGKYTHKLAHLVITIAGGMRDNHLDGNITSAIDDYHQFEQETLAKMMGNDSD